MNSQEAGKFLDHFNNGLYIKTIDKPLIHGYFTDAEKLEEALGDINEDRTLYFIANELKDNSVFPSNHLDKIPKGGSVKLEDLSTLKCFVLDIDPNKGSEIIDGKRVKRNLSVTENLEVVEDAKAIKAELLINGFQNVGVINSGNGAYLIFPFKGISLTDDGSLEDVTELLNKFAQILARRVKLKHSSIDFKTIKLSQCFKLPGTLSTKGTPTKSNPYRHACIVEDWDPKVSCWDAIREYVDAYDTSDLVYTDSFGTHFHIPNCIKRCEKEFPVAFGGNHDYLVRVDRDSRHNDLHLDSGDFAKELRLFLRRETGLLVVPDTVVTSITDYLKDQAYQCDRVPVASRAYYDSGENTVYYDLCNDKEVVKITADGISVIDKPFGMFSRQLGDKEQVMFTPTPATELPTLLGKVAKLSLNNLIVLATFLCVCFLGSFFPTPICLITGPQGSSKSTLTRMIQRIVHPQLAGLLSLLEKKEDIAIALSRRLLTCFDNATGVKAEISDMLCTAVTKGVFQRRELYTTRDECLIEYVSIMVINGIDVISRRTDLMERCIMLEMEQIKPEERKTEKEVEEVFVSILPSILGAIFCAIQRVLAMDDIVLPTLSRMADFESWSAKFAVAMGFTAEQYQEALQENLKNLVDAVSFGNPTIFAVVEVMRGREKYESSVQEFYQLCDKILTEKLTVNEKSTFPKSPAALSRMLGGMVKNLQSFGITFIIQNVGPNKNITIYNDGTKLATENQAEKVGKIAYANAEEDMAAISEPVDDEQ